MIYYIYDKLNNAVKIGYARSIVRRLGNYYSHNINPLFLLIVEQGDLDVEKNIHKEYNDLQIVTEWFKCDGRLKEKLVCECSFDFLNMEDYSNYKELNKLTLEKYKLPTSYYECLSEQVKKTMIKNKKIKKKTKLDDLKVKSYSQLDNLFIKKDDAIIPVSEIKEYLTKNNVVSSSGKGIIPVSKVVKHFGAKLKNVRYGKDTKQCVVGLGVI